MSIFSKFLRSGTKTPKFLRPLLGKTWLDEIGAVGGFVGSGFNPLGAAAGAVGGRAGYGAAQGEDIGSIARGSVGTGLKAGALAYGGQALAGAGAGNAVGRGSYEAARQAGGSGGVGAQLKSLLSGGGRAVDWLTDEDQGAARTLLASNLLSTGTGVMAGRAQGAVEDDERSYTRERDARRDAERDRLFKMLSERFAARPSMRAS